MQETSNYRDQLFNSYAKLRYIAASVGPISEADDLVHDAFEYFLKKEDQYKDHENLEAIVILKMKSINIDKWRKKSGTNFEEKDEEFIKDTLYGNENDYEKIERMKDFVKGFSKIGDKCKEILNLSLEYTYAEIAKTLDIQPMTVGSRLSRCYEELRGTLQNV
tara:strand:+ start:549 stop:1037 length:489 start_codon:yes stop_codon:yes gene_type:complete